MAEPLSRDVVAHVAHLARIELDDDEIEHFRARLARVLEHAAEIEGLDLDDVEPTSHVVALSNVLRDDVVGPTLDRDEVLAEAPSTEAGQFRVPAILGDDE